MLNCCYGCGEYRADSGPGSNSAVTIPYALTPDDSRFIFRRPAVAAAPEPRGGRIFIAENWFNELRSRLPN